MTRTQGPWTISTWPQKGGGIGIGVGITGTTPCIANVLSRDVPTNEQEANTHLISAAPDMYEALKEVESELLVVDMEVPGYIIVAIAKAEGKDETP